MKPLVTAIGICAFLLAGNGVHADIHIWDNDNGDDLWSSQTNWVNNQVPIQDDNIWILTDPSASPSYVSKYDSGMGATSFGALRLGGGMDLENNYSDSLSFDSTSFTGDCELSGAYDTSLGNATVDDSSVTLTTSDAGDRFASNLTIDADTADDSRALIKEGSGTLAITNAVTLIAGTHETKSTIADNAILDVNGGTVTANDLNLYGGACNGSFGSNGRALVDMASGTTLTVGEDMYVTGDGEFETDVNVSMDGLYIGSSNDEAYLYKSGSGTLSVDRLVIQGGPAGNGYCIVGGGNLSVN